MPSKKERSLDSLRTILFPDLEQKLQQLTERISEVDRKFHDESLIETLQPVIGDLLERKVSSSREEMAVALAPIMGNAIKHQVQEAKDDIIDALYPVIGKTIRKAVAEAMRKLATTLNRKIERALRRSFFKRRLQAKIAGIPERDLLLKAAIPFQVEEIFVIHKDSGLLLAHVSSKQAGVTVDEELISGMLTAIKDFVSEAFRTEHDRDLDEIQYGESKIKLEMGHCFYLAIVVSGVEPDQFSEEVQQLSRHIHNRYHKPLRQFDGDITQFRDMPQLLQRFLAKFHPQPREDQPQESKPYLLYLLLLLAIIGAGVLAWKQVPRFLARRQIYQNIKARIETVPDLRDQHIRYRLSGGQLVLSGEVNSLRQRAIVDSLVKTIKNIGEVDNRLAIKTTGAHWRQTVAAIKQRMKQSAAFRSVQADFIIEDNCLIIEGTAPNLQTKRDIGFLVSDVSGVKFVVNNLKISRQDQSGMEQAKEIVHNYKILFDVNGYDIPTEEQAKLDSIYRYVQNLENIKLVIKGYSDNLADSIYNLKLSEQRARSVFDYLTTMGLPDTTLIIRYYGERDSLASNLTAAGRAQNRRVEFDIISQR